MEPEIEASQVDLQHLSLPSEFSGGNLVFLVKVILILVVNNYLTRTRSQEKGGR